MSFLITFEGIDGCGKTTQVNRLKKYLTEELGYTVHICREPGTSKEAEKIREIILDPENNLYPLTELLLFSAARNEFASKILAPYMKEDDNTIVLCDRYILSTLAYQGYGNRIMDSVHDILAYFKHTLYIPDLTFIFDIDYDTMIDRIQQADKPLDRIEQKPREYFEEVIKGFVQQRDQYTKESCLIDGTLPQDTITEKCIHAILTCIADKLLSTYDHIVGKDDHDV